MAGGARIFTSLAEAEGRFGPSAITIGNFDGVHRGHQRLLERVVAMGRLEGWKPSVVTFDPHPARIVAPERAPRLLSSPAERVVWMERAGVQQVLIMPFSHEFSQRSGDDFIADVLVAKLGARGIVVGGNFRFGRDHAGDTGLLVARGDRYGYRAEVVPGLLMRGVMVSSSEVRRQIETGNVALAARMLGRCYALHGRVVPGRGVGSRKTVPTLNLATHAEVLPATGVYVTRTHDRESERWWPSVTNVGRRPTFGGGDLSIESFLLEPLEGTPPEQISVEFLRRLREEKKFASAEALRAQILRDAERARAWHRRTKRWRRAVDILIA